MQSMRWILLVGQWWVGIVDCFSSNHLHRSAIVAQVYQGFNMWKTVGRIFVGDLIRAVLSACMQTLCDGVVKRQCLRARGSVQPLRSTHLLFHGSCCSIGVAAVIDTTNGVSRSAYTLHLCVCVLFSTTTVSDMRSGYRGAPLWYLTRMSIILRAV